MVAYSFQARFIVPIVEKTKRQTIRHSRKGQAKAGSTLQLYYAQRSTFCRLLGTATCIKVTPVIIGPFNYSVYFPSRADSISSFKELDEFAVADGFSDWDDLRAFWQKMHPEVYSFRGDLIEWGYTLTPSAKG